MKRLCACKTCRKGPLGLILGVCLTLTSALVPWAEAGSWPVVVRDALGRTVAVPAPPRRMVVLNSNALDAVRILGAADLVVGVSSLVRNNTPYWRELAALPEVGKWNSPNLEAIAALDPDMVLTYGNNPGQEIEALLGPLGITVLRLDFHHLSTLEREMEVLGRVLERPDKARDYLAWHRGWLERIRSMVAPLIGGAGGLPKAYVESYASYRVSGPGSSIDEMVRAAGMRNIADVMAVPFAEVTPEWVAASEPVIMIKAGSTRDSYACSNPDWLESKRRSVLARPGWEHVVAVRDGRVLVLSSDVCPGTRAVVGVAYMARFAHPELAGSVDPEAIHREYLERFVGLPLRGCYAVGEARP